VENTLSDFIKLVRSIYSSNEYIPLHRPVFEGNEKIYLTECIDSNFVSSVGKKVTQFEEEIAKFCQTKFAIATVNGTSALHTSLILAGVEQNDEVITQALTFIATCNAISYIKAHPVFLDVDKDTMGLSPTALVHFLSEQCERRGNYTFNKKTKRRIKACVPMHTFGLPCRIEELSTICSEWNILLIEDAAESLGSFVKEKHTGSFGSLGTFSFNGNKIITTGGGGMIITSDAQVAQRAKHITTTAKVPHPYEFVHDEIGFNYRLPNLNAALGCAQMESLNKTINIKQQIANTYLEFFNDKGITMATPLPGYRSNNWLNTVILENKYDRDQFLKHTNDSNVMTRPIWRLMSDLEMFKTCFHDGLENSKWLEDRVVNIPSSVPNLNWTTEHIRL